MPSVGNVLECCTHSSWFGDVDAGEMFLNFPLDLAIRPYCGVDVSWMEEGKKTTWESWHRMAMGMKPSPWVTCRLIGWMLELVVGDKKDAKNPFRWDTVILNLPGDKDYDPNLPRVFKWNDMLQSIACDVKVFVDDFRITGPSYTATTLATHRLETRMGYLGIQDATRKRRKVTQRPGEWTGSIVTAVEDVGLFVTITKTKWSKVQNILKKWEEKVRNDTQPRVNLKELERDVGFLVHISMAFPSVKPFLRGFYLSMNSWRQDRDSAGWKMSWRSYRVFLAMGRREGTLTEDAHYRASSDSPQFVKLIPLFREHLNVLLRMFRSPEPSLRLVRGCGRVEVLYAFGDASGEGFGTSWMGEGSVKFRYGLWGVEGDGSSSNYREFKNLVDSLEDMGKCGDLKGKEVFIFTDNTTSERHQYCLA